MDEVSVDVQPTPNVNALKFVLNRKLTEGRSRTFRSEAEAEAAEAPYAQQLLQIPGVVQVFVLNDFITVTRDPGADWNAILPKAEEILKTSLS
ncbi:MAG: NifU N-terminal domain-containing protein [bacterium]